MHSYIDLGNPVSDHPLNYGLVSWWLPLPNNQGGSRLMDITARRNHAVLTNGPTWATASSGMAAVSFDGSNDYGLVPTHTRYDGNVLSVVFTGRVTAGEAFGGIFAIGDGGGYHLTFQGDGTPTQVQMYSNGGGATNSGIVFSDLTTTATWVWVFNAGSFTSYKNGFQFSTASYTAGSAVTGKQLVIAGDRGTTANTTTRLDSFAIYDRALSASDAAGVSAEARTLYPNTLRRFSRRVYTFPQAAGGGTTSHHLTLLGVGG